MPIALPTTIIHDKKREIWVSNFKISNIIFNIGMSGAKLIRAKINKNLVKRLCCINLSFTYVWCASTFFRCYGSSLQYVSVSQNKTLHMNLLILVISSICVAIIFRTVWAFSICSVEVFITFIIFVPFTWIAQCLICLLNQSKKSRSIWCIINIRMIFFCQCSIWCLYLLLWCVFINS